MKSQSSVSAQSDLPRSITVNDTDSHPLIAPMRTAIEIPEPTRPLHKLAIPFEPQRELAEPVTHSHHPHNDPSASTDARVPGEVLLEAAKPTHHRHWGINE